MFRRSFGIVKACAFALVFALSNLAVASEILKSEFESTFYTHYVEGKCGRNTAALIERALAKGADMTGARVIVVTNDGYHFSTTHRRNAGDKLETPLPGIRFSPGIKNFFFHVLLEKDGLIYDFDFGNEPAVVSLEEYIRRMFWEEPERTQYTGLEPLTARRQYNIAFVPYEHYLRELSATGFPQLKLGELYESLPLGE